MIYPIVAYGDPVLRRRGDDVKPDMPGLKQFIEDMFETMYAAHGVGLAAPQVGKSLRLFVVDAEGMDKENLKGFKKVFINPEIIEETGDAWAYEEGCLSIPGIRQDVARKGTLTIRYYDADFIEHTETFDGLKARVIQHEYDHIEGILFVDHLSGLKKQLLKNKLAEISRGRTSADYRMKFPLKK